MLGTHELDETLSELKQMEVVDERLEEIAMWWVALEPFSILSHILTQLEQST